MGYIADVGMPRGIKDCQDISHSALLGPSAVALFGHYPKPAMRETVQLEVYFSGRVQGVGFRYRVKSLSTGYYVTGTVRNLADGRVHMMAEGEKAELEDFLRAILESELGSHIRNFSQDWHSATGSLKGFEIIR